MFDAFQIRSMTKEDLPIVLSWRNHEHIRRYMFTQHDISLDEHRSWFATASQDTSRRLLIVEEDKHVIGYVQFSKVEEGGNAEWGFYCRPDAPKGSGRILGAMALNHAFGLLKLHKVCGQVVATNKASIAFHQQLGFVLEGVLRDQQRINGSYHCLHCFGLLSTEWQPKEFE